MNEHPDIDSSDDIQMEDIFESKQCPHPQAAQKRKFNRKSLSKA